ncbi:hypothetical protein NV379_10615 [Paenibacillus sp. N1-5-1-14]|uniref:hypothetical protein n=1 Tax=Paenibacillus radicibacter TaxID=2972488 RepID=UPI0021595369|nr:hypothetical protein [Paenibacillus radicibacter]MCR8643111.1 hypothetical protein [Paenibacillus radicibacter]
MPSIVEIGPFVIRGSLLTLVLSCIAGFGILMWQLRRIGDTKSPIFDLFASVILIVFAGWKLSPLLSEPSLIWTDPLKLLMVSGSNDGLFAGVVIALVYMQVRMRKTGLSALTVMDAAGYFATAAVLLYQALSDDSSHWYMALLSAAIICILIIKKNTWMNGDGAVAQFVLLGFGVGGLAVSLLTPQTIAFLYLSSMQLLFIVLTLASIAFPKVSSTWIDVIGEAHTNVGKE